MLQILVDSQFEMFLAQRNDPVKTFILDRSHKPFGLGVAFRRLNGTQHGIDPKALQ
jgi:hypothetical protein